MEETAKKGLYTMCQQVICSPTHCAKAKKCCEQAFNAYNSVAAR